MHDPTLPNARPIKTRVFRPPPPPFAHPFAADTTQGAQGAPSTSNPTIPALGNVLAASLAQPTVSPASSSVDNSVTYDPDANGSDGESAAAAAVRAALARGDLGDPLPRTSGHVPLMLSPAVFHSHRDDPLLRRGPAAAVPHLPDTPIGPPPTLGTSPTVGNDDDDDDDDASSSAHKSRPASADDISFALATAPTQRFPPASAAIFNRPDALSLRPRYLPKFGQRGFGQARAARSTQSSDDSFARDAMDVDLVQEQQQQQPDAGSAPDSATSTISLPDAAGVLWSTVQVAFDSEAPTQVLGQQLDEEAPTQVLFGHQPLAQFQMSGNEAPTQVLPPAPGQVGTEALTQLLGNAPLPCTPPFAVHDLAALSPRSRHLYSEAPTQILPPTQLPEGQRSPSHVAHTPPAAVILAGFDYERSVARLKANAGNDPIPNLPYSSGSSHSSDDEASKKDNQDTASDSTYPLSLLPPPPPPPPLRMQMPEFANDGGSGVGAPIGLPPATRFTSTIPSSPAVFCAGDESPADTPAAATTMRSANADPFGRKRSPCPVRPTTIPCTGSNDTTTFSGTAADDSTLLFPGATPSQVPIPNPNTVLKASARAMPLLVDTPHGQSDAPPVAVAAAAAAPGAHRTPENDDSFMDIDGNDSLLGGVMSADPLGPKHPHHGGALDIFASSASPIPLSHLENASLADSYVPPAFGDSVMPDPSHAPLDELSSANTVMLTAESMDLGETPVKRFRSMVGPFSSLGRQYEPPVTYPDASVSQTLKHVTTDVPAVPLALQLGDGDEDSIPIGATSPEHPNAPMDVGPKSDDTSLFSFPTTSPPTRAVSEPPLPPLPHPKPTRRRILANGAQEQVERALQRRRAHIFPAGTPIRILSPIAQSPDTVPPQARSPQGTPSARNTSLLPAVRRMTLSSCSDSDDEPPAVTAMRRVIHTSDDDHDHDDDNDVDSDTDKTDELIAHSPPERGPRKRRRTAFDRGGTKLATVARPTTPTAPVAPAMAMAAPTTTGRKRPRLDPVLTSPLPPSSLESSRTRPARRSRPTSFRRQESSSDEPDDPNDPSYETQSMVETSAPPAPTPRYQRPSPIVPAVAAVAASGGKRRGLQAAADSPLSEISGSPPPPPPPAGIDVTAPGPIIRLSSRRGTLTVEKEPPPPTRSYATDDLVWARTAGAAQQFYVGRIRGRASLSAENEVQYRIKLLSGERLQVPFEHIRPYVPLDIGQHAYAYVTTSEIAPVVIVEVAEDEADEYIVETAERRRVHVAVDRMILSVDQIRSMDRHRTPLARDLITPPQPPPVLARQESAPTPMHPSRSTQRRRNGRTRATRPGPASSPLRERPRTADPMDVDHMDVDHQLQSPPVSEPAAVTMRPTSIKATSTPARAAPPPATAPTLETAPSTAVKAASNRALPQRMSPRRRQSSRIFDGLHFVITMIKSNDAVDGSSQIPDPDEIPMTVVSGNPQFERPLIERLITELGGTLVENVAGLGAMNDQTHPTVFCIASAPRRSHKFLLALALGIPRISCQWVLDCFSKASLIPHTFYQLPNGNSTELRGYISAIFAPSIFAGRSFAIQLPHAAREEWRLTLTAAQATIVALKSNPDFILGSPATAKKGAVPFRRGGGGSAAGLMPSSQTPAPGTPAHVSIEWAVQCLINQRILDPTRLDVYQS